MPVRMLCPYCDSCLKVAESLHKKRIRCPGCQKKVMVYDNLQLTKEQRLLMEDAAQGTVPTMVTLPAVAKNKAKLHTSTDSAGPILKGKVLDEPEFLSRPEIVQDDMEIENPEIIDDPEIIEDFDDAEVVDDPEIVEDTETVPDENITKVTPSKKKSAPKKAGSRKRQVPDDEEDEVADDQEDEVADDEAEPVRKKKKKKKKGKNRPKESIGQRSGLAAVPTWAWMGAATFVCVFAFVVFVAAMMLHGGDKGKVGAVVGVIFLVTLPISTAIFIFSMFASSFLGGGINFGDAKTAIFKSMLLITVATIIGMIPMLGWIIGYAVWLLGAMFLFGLDFWEAQFFININWLLNFLVKMFLILAIVGYVMGPSGAGFHGPAGNGGRPARGASTDPAEREEEAVLLIEELGGFVETDEKAKDEPIVLASLTGTKVKSRDLKVLADLPELRKLDLSNTKIDDSALPHLYGLKKLTFVNLAGTQVTRAGVESLQKQLPLANITH